VGDAGSRVPDGMHLPVHAFSFNEEVFDSLSADDKVKCAGMRHRARHKSTQRDVGWF
jgi:hypothetical protein